MNNKDFGEWLTEHRNLFYQEARRYFSDWDDIDEAVQEASVRLWKLDQKGTIKNLGGTARVVTRFVCLSILKTKTDRGEVSYTQDAHAHLADTFSTGSPPVEQEDLSNIPWFAAMSPEDRGFAILLYQGRSEREIAVLWGNSRGSVRHHKHMLRRRLNATLQDRHYGPIPDR